MIETILTFIFNFAIAVTAAGICVMIYAANFIPRDNKDSNSIYIIGVIYAIAGIVLMIACPMTF